MSIKIGLTKRVVCDQKASSTVVASPADIRQLEAAAMQSITRPGLTRSVAWSKASIVVNGQEYSSPDEMPPEVRQAYETAMSKFAAFQGEAEVLTESPKTIGDARSSAKKASPAPDGRRQKKPLEPKSAGFEWAVVVLALAVLCLILVLSGVIKWR